jgi:hypothetical protein
MVVVVTGLRNGRPRNRSLTPGRGKRFVFSPKLADGLMVPPIVLYSGLSTTDFKNKRSYTSTSPYTVMACTGTTVTILCCSRFVTDVCGSNYEGI